MSAYLLLDSAGAAIQPTKDQILNIRANFISMQDSWGRPMLSWFAPVLPETELADWVQRWRAARLTHVVLCPVMQYPGYMTDRWADWRTQPDRFAAAVTRILRLGFIPILQMTSGDGGTGNDVTTYWPGLLNALQPVIRYCMGSCGFEVVGPGGGWTSAQLSRGLGALHAAGFGVIGVHLQPERATGASHPVEPDDPWQGDEAGFWTSHGGQYADCLLYQCPHGDKLLDRSLTGPASWTDRWDEIAFRLGAGNNSWRKVPLCCFEKTGFDYNKGRATDDDVRYTSAQALTICQRYGVTCTFGDGLP